MENPIGHFKCLKCGHEWKGILSNFGTACIRCAHVNVKWLNYEELRKKFFIGY